MYDGVHALPETQAVCGFSVEDIAQVLADLLPEGWVWPRDADSVQQRTMLALAAEYHRLYARDCQLLAESYPCGALETLPDWERVLGLPDPCTGPLETVQQRRAAVCAKMSTFIAPTVRGIEDYLRTLGFEVEIEEGPGPFDFQVFVAGLNPVWFRAEGSSATESIRIWGNDMLDCGIEYIKPAHTRAILNFLVPADWDSGASVWDDNDTFWDEGVRAPDAMRR
jgi:uncharacterized protein YmfQ (DUF2313 family)